MPKFQWDHPMLSNGAQVPFSSREIDRTVSVSSDPYKVCTHFKMSLYCNDPFPCSMLHPHAPSA